MDEIKNKIIIAMSIVIIILIGFCLAIHFTGTRNSDITRGLESAEKGLRDTEHSIERAGNEVDSAEEGIRDIQRGIGEIGETNQRIQESSRRSSEIIDGSAELFERGKTASRDAENIFAKVERSNRLSDKDKQKTDNAEEHS